jgi:hypothetical protein
MDKETIFISYAREDKNDAERLYDDLHLKSKKAWIDTKCIIPGQDFDKTIRQAIRKSRYFLALHSTRSVSKKGYVQYELREAVKVAQEFPTEDIYLIPIRLDDCRTPLDIENIHRVDMFPSWEDGFMKLLSALQPIRLETEINLQKKVTNLPKLNFDPTDWGDGCNAWIANFHSQLEKYCLIYATDLYYRTSINNINYNKYLRQQYYARQVKLRSRSNLSLSFSSPVYNAIDLTKWRPDQDMWPESEYPINESACGSHENLEIVRILVRPKVALEDHQILKRLDAAHRYYAIPLFVIDPKHLQLSQLFDCAIGFDKDVNIIKCFKFSEDKGIVEEVSQSKDSYNLKDNFIQMLGNPHLETVEQFLGHQA